MNERVPFVAGSRPADNPFRMSRVDGLEYRLEDGFTWGRLIRSCREAGSGAVCGPHGSGKSTLLRTLERHLRESGSACHRLRLREDGRVAWWREWRHIRAVWADGGFFLLDSAGLLPAWRRRALALLRPSGAVLLATLHEPCRYLPVVHVCRSVPQLAFDLAHSLAPGIDRWEVQREFDRNGGDLRGMFGALYDRQAACHGTEHVPPDISRHPVGRKKNPYRNRSRFR